MCKPDDGIKVRRMTVIPDEGDMAPYRKIRFLLPFMHRPRNTDDPRLWNSIAEPLGLYR